MVKVGHGTHETRGTCRVLLHSLFIRFFVAKTMNARDEWNLTMRLGVCMASTSSPLFFLLWACSCCSQCCAKYGVI